MENFYVSDYITSRKRTNAISLQGAKLEAKGEPPVVMLKTLAFH